MNQIQRTLGVAFKQNVPVQVIQLIHNEIESKGTYHVRLILDGCQAGLKPEQQKAQNQFRKIVYPHLIMFDTEQLKLNSSLLTNQSIVGQVSHVNFSSLKMLEISCSILISLQAISWLDCPQLQRLWINNDHRPISLRSVSRCNFNKLKSMNMQIEQTIIDNRYHFLQRVRTSKQIQVSNMVKQRMIMDPIVFMAFHMRGMIKSEVGCKIYQRLKVKVDEDMEKLDNILERMERDNLLNRDGDGDGDDGDDDDEDDNQQVQLMYI